MFLVLGYALNFQQGSNTRYVMRGISLKVFLISLLKFVVEITSNFI